MASGNSLIKRLAFEQETIAHIIRAFKHWEYARHYQVGSYDIDLYFTKQKLAIECDKLGHNDGCSQYEQTRQQYIEKTLGCKFIRYNPDADDFSVFDVINQIITSI